MASEDSDFDEDEIDSLVESSIQGLLNSKVISLPNFLQLNDRLLSSSASILNCPPKSKLQLAQSQSSIYQSVSHEENKKSSDNKTLGKGWFDMQPMVMNEALKRDIKIIQNRNFLNPKRFYKKLDKIGQVLHVGTVIEGPTEFKASRLKRKDRKQSILDEVLADSDITNYSKRSYLQLQESAKSKRKYYKDKRQSDKKKKKRRLRGV